MQKTLVPLAHLVREAADMVRLSYPGQRIDLAGPGEAHVYADPARLVQVLANLIDNAAKYSPEGTPIAVAWSLEGGMATVRVRDHGPGVPEEGRDRLFTRFGRLPASQMRAGRVGTGLGLFLGRQIIEAMDGSLELEGTGPLGSTFRLCLPMLPVEAPPP
jgi:signal transduction histidine kinase